MKCQNCGSNDIIAIQGQTYCINCGQLVESKGASSPIRKFISPQRPQPKPLVTANVGNAIRSEPSKLNQSNSSGNSRKTNIKSGEFSRRPLLDLRENKSISTEEGPGNISIKAHTNAFISKLAFAIAAPSGLALAAALYLRVDTDLILYGSIGGSVLAGLSIMTLHSALLYGGSKARDGRIIPESQWWALAKSRFTEVLLINTLAAAGMFVLAVGAYGFYAMSQLLPVEMPILQIGALLIANIFVSWLSVGLFCIRRLTIAIVTIGGQPALEAYRMAWGMYRDYGGHLILSAAETTLVKLMAVVTAVVIGFCAYMFVQAYSGYEPVAYGLAALISIALWMIVFLRFEISIWLSRYRWIAGQQSARVKSQLLAGGISR